MPITAPFPHVADLIRALSISPEVVQGVPNWSFAASGGAVGNVTIDTAGGAGAHDAALATMADGWLVGAQIRWRAGSANAGRFSTVVTCARVAAIVTLTFSNLPTAVLAGDLFYVSVPVPASDISTARTVDALERDITRKTFEKPSSFRGLVRGSGSFVAETFGLASPAVGAAPARDFFSHVLDGIGTRFATTGLVTAGGSTATDIVTVADPTGVVEVGDLVMIGGEVRRVTTLDIVAPFGIIVSPALSAAPAGAVDVFAPERHIPGRTVAIGTTDTGGEASPRSYTVLHLVDGQLTEIRGAVMRPKVSGDFGQPVKLSMEFDGEWAGLYDSSDFDYLLPARTPLAFVLGAAHFGASALCLNSFEFDFGVQTSETLDTCGGLRYDARDRQASCKVVFRETGVLPIMTWDANATSAALLITVGAAAGSAMSFLIPEAVFSASPGHSSVNNTRYWDGTFAATHAQTSVGCGRPYSARF
jgi:hypothetical protein